MPFESLFEKFHNSLCVGIKEAGKMKVGFSVLIMIVEIKEQIFKIVDFLSWIVICWYAKSKVKDKEYKEEESRCHKTLFKIAPIKAIIIISLRRKLILSFIINR